MHETQNSFFKTRSEVNINVTGTQGWRATLFHPKMHHYTKFGIPTSDNIGDMLRKRSFYKLGQRSRSRSQ